jgi:serine carboxypeptidase-like clade 1
MYSGDQDLSVPHTGTQGWTIGLASQVEDYWRAWTVDGQVREI